MGQVGKGDLLPLLWSSPCTVSHPPTQTSQFSMVGWRWMDHVSDEPDVTGVTDNVMS